MKNHNLNQNKYLINHYTKPLGVTNKKVLQAMLKTPRHEFVPKTHEAQAYYDIALPIGHGQTISQPSLVGIMTQALKLKGRETVLEIGTGSAYQAAILSRLAKQVYTVEIIEDLYKKAKKVLKKLNIKNVTCVLGNGSVGLKKYAPYDAIIVTAAAKHVPQELLNELKVGGRMVIPVVEHAPDLQELKVITKHKNIIGTKKITPVIFVPLVGKYTKGPKPQKNLLNFKKMLQRKHE